MQGIKRRSEIPCFPKPREHRRRSRPIVVQLFPGRTTSEAGKDRSESQEGFFSLLRRSRLHYRLPRFRAKPRSNSSPSPSGAPSQEARARLDVVFRQCSLRRGEQTHAGNIKSHRCCSRRRKCPTGAAARGSRRQAENSGTPRASSQQAVRHGRVIFWRHEEQGTSIDMVSRRARWLDNIVDSLGVS